MHTRPLFQQPVPPLLPWCGLLALIAGAAVAFALRQSIDYPVMRFLNGLHEGASLVERAVLTPGRFDVLGGPVFVALIWLVWFDSADHVSRLRIVSGIAGAAAAGALSRALQLALHAHPRPIHDPGLAFAPPPWINPDVLNHWSSFPSDHAALFFGLATVVFLLRPRIGVAALAWATLVDLNRVYEGLHFLSDVVGGAGLGVTLVCLSQRPRVAARFEFVVRWAWRGPAVFYASAFVVMYEIANLFEDVRDMGHALSHLFQS